MTQEDMQQFLDIFVQESSDRFDELNRDLVLLEQDPSNEELLYNILRHVHSVKGSAGMFGFENMKRIGHRMEDLMEHAHADPSKVDRQVMDLLFEGSDLLQAIFRLIQEGRPETQLTANDRRYIESLDDVIQRFFTGGESLPTLLEDFLGQIDEVMGALESIWDTTQLRERMVQIRAALNVREAAETGEPEAAPTRRFILGETDISEQTHRVQTQIAKAEKEPLEEEESANFFENILVILQAAQKLELPSLAESLTEAEESIEVFQNLGLDFDSLQAEFFGQILDEILPHCQTVEVNKPSKAATADEPGEREDRTPIPSALARKSVRIEESKIDAFLDSVGEMIILGEAFNHLEKRLADCGGVDLQTMREFKTTNSAFGSQIFTLQESLMTVRRVELRNVTGSLSRLVRDTARDLGKKIELSVVGEEAVIDKSLLDDLNTCLVHIVRNAADHGIETPEEREAVGKAPGGVIEIEAINEEGFLAIHIRDDGRGIDRDKLCARAVENGIYTAEQVAALSEREINDLIFAEGLSTAQQVSDVSGRGVGMSAVIANIRKMGGTVDVNSEPGQGTTIALRIPLSIMLSVIDGLVVRCGGTGFVIPIRYVVESFHPAAGQVSTVQGKGECVQLRGELFPMIRFADFFSLDKAEQNPQRAVGILLQIDERKTCILVDEIIDHQQVVIKEMDGLGNILGILGGALLGDGSIGLVLNCENLTI